MKVTRKQLRALINEVQNYKTTVIRNDFDRTAGRIRASLKSRFVEPSRLYTAHGQYGSGKTNMFIGLTKSTRRTAADLVDDIQRILRKDFGGLRGVVITDPNDLEGIVLNTAGVKDLQGERVSGDHDALQAWFSGKEPLSGHDPIVAVVMTKFGTGAAAPMPDRD